MSHRLPWLIQRSISKNAWARSPCDRVTYKHQHQQCVAAATQDGYVHPCGSPGASSVVPTRNVADFTRFNETFRSLYNPGNLQAPPARKVAVVTCMDARLHPEAFLGLKLGDAHMIRNAGGRVSEDAIRSLVISQRMLGTEEVLVIHHTDCGMFDMQRR